MVKDVKLPSWAARAPREMHGGCGEGGNPRKRLSAAGQFEGVAVRRAGRDPGQADAADRRGAHSLHLQPVVRSSEPCLRRLGRAGRDRDLRRAGQPHPRVLKYWKLHGRGTGRRTGGGIAARGAAAGGGGGGRIRS